MRTSLRTLVVATAAASVLGAVVAPSSATPSAPAPDHAAQSSAAAFPETIPLPDGFQPEGIVSGDGTTFYVGSLVDGAIYAGDFRTGRGGLLAPGVGSPAAGLEYEADAGRLWVAGGDSGLVKVYDVATAELLQTYDVDGAGFLNDVAVTDDAVYVTDSLVQQVVVLPFTRPGTLPLSVRRLPLTGDISYGPEFNANGIVAAQGGRTLIIVQSNVGKLFRVDSATGVSDEIALTGGDVLNGDGLFLLRRTLYVVQNQQDKVGVVKLGFDLRGGTYTGALTDPDLDVPTTATVDSGYLWAVNARFNTVPTPTTSYDVVRLPLRLG